MNKENLLSDTFSGLLSGKTALVCGASQGIGQATAMALAQAGAQVILLARSEDKLKSLKAQLPGGGHQIIAVDMNDTERLKSLVEKHLPIHIIVNNSGGPKAGPLLEAQADDFINGLKNHIISAQALAQLCVPGMKAAQFGRIINIVSTSVKTPIANLGVSNTVRAAMANWAKTLSQEVGAHNITVNNILPGFTLTPRLEALRKNTADRLKMNEAQVDHMWKSTIPLGRYAEASEVAAAILFLASPLASYISGINLPVDGGRTASL